LELILGHKVVTMNLKEDEKARRQKKKKKKKKEKVTF
jgi:hypothetical protein